jgi:hypothetical protein
MAGTPFITPATAAKWDDGKRGNFVQHVAAKVRVSRIAFLSTRCLLVALAGGYVDAVG